MPRDTSESVPNTIDGSAAAVFVACGAACLTMGALAALAEMLPGLKGLLAFYAPAGSLSGKAAISVLVFIGARLVLDRAWRTRAIDTRRCIVWSALMVASGLVGTFPPFFYLFG